MSSSHFLEISQSKQRLLITAARDNSPVRGLTHGFYKYPARFSPMFARAAIEVFTKPRQLVLDPYVGGGTSIVEARALGREAVGVDISQLAEFVARVKCMVFSETELKRLKAWGIRVPKVVDIRGRSIEFSEHAELGYYRHLEHPSRWRLRKAIEQALASAIRLDTPKLEAFGRCAVLRTAQWALDGRSKLPAIDEFRAMLGTIAARMVEGAREFRAAVRKNGCSSVRVINRTAAGLEDDERLREIRPPRLVLTSPPYPGVHVLYHRWQVDGRKETPLPFMIADKLDGAGSSYYTMGDRKYPKLRTYREYQGHDVICCGSGGRAHCHRSNDRVLRTEVAAGALSRNNGRGRAYRSSSADAPRRARRTALAKRTRPPLVQRSAWRDTG